MKGKKTGLKRGLAVILASLFVLSMIVTSIARTWTGKINTFFGTTSYKTEKERQDAEDHNAGVQALRDEAIRVVKAMPKWTPGKQNGEAVRCRYSLPVIYRLN